MDRSEQDAVYQVLAGAAGAGIGATLGKLVGHGGGLTVASSFIGLAFAAWQPEMTHRWFGRFWNSPPAMLSGVVVACVVSAIFAFMVPGVAHELLLGIASVLLGVFLTVTIVERILKQSEERRYARVDTMVSQELALLASKILNTLYDLHPDHTPGEAMGAGNERTGAITMNEGFVRFMEEKLTTTESSKLFWLSMTPRKIDEARTNFQEYKGEIDRILSVHAVRVSEKNREVLMKVSRGLDMSLMIMVGDVVDNFPEFVVGLLSMSTIFIVKDCIGLASDNWVVGEPAPGWEENVKKLGQEI